MMEKALKVFNWIEDCIKSYRQITLDDSDRQIIKEAKEELEEAMKPKTCEWKQCTSEYDTSWEGTCDVKWLLIDGTPTKNHMQFCPNCGGKLIEIEQKDNA